jgi:hypothetical protein
MFTTINVFRDASRRHAEYMHLGAHGLVGALEQRAPTKFWHKVVAFLIGYVAAGIVYVILEQLLGLTYVLAFGMTGLSSLSFTDVRNFIRAAAGLVAIYVWVKVYRYCVANWWQEKQQ